MSRRILVATSWGRVLCSSSPCQSRQRSSRQSSTPPLATRPVPGEGLNVSAAATGVPLSTFALDTISGEQMLKLCGRENNTREGVVAGVPQLRSAAGEGRGEAEAASEEPSRRRHQAIAGLGLGGDRASAVAAAINRSGNGETKRLAGLRRLEPKW